MSVAFGKGLRQRRPLDVAPARSGDPIAELIRLEVRLAGWTRSMRDAILAADPDEDRHPEPFSDYGFKWPAYTLAHLYATPHPDNPLHGTEWCPELAMELVDKSVACWRFRRDRGHEVSSREVPFYVMPYVLRTLGDRVNAGRRAAWIEWAESYAEMALRRPLGRTACYHDSWRMTALRRLGQALDRPQWSEAGVYFFKQMLALQTKEGFFEDGRHHGPSLRYCGLMLPSLAWMYRDTADEAFGEAARRLARFVSTWTHPDAVTIGAFDGRNSSVLAFFPVCAGMELIPEGRVFNARALRLWRELGMLDGRADTAQSTRDTPRLAFYAADTCRYLSLYAPEPSQSVDERGALPGDADGILENHSTEFDGVLARQGSWQVALSAQNSDIPRVQKTVLRLERQSRIEIWHAQARLIIGGGHNRIGDVRPLASALLDPGGCGHAGFGFAETLDKGFRDTYMPRVSRTRVREGVPELELIFGHGTVRFHAESVDESRIALIADWEAFRLARLCLQLPLVLWRGACLLLDGREISLTTLAEHTLSREARVRGGPFGCGCRVRIPEGAHARVHAPIEAEQYFEGRMRDDPIAQPMRLALLSCQWSSPPARGQARFEIDIVS